MNNSDCKRRVLLINGAVYLPGEGGYKRTMYLFDMMKRMGYPVKLLTNDFNHYKKQIRNIDQFRKDYPTYDDIEFIHTPAYERNVSFKRFWSEKVWTREVKKWLSTHIHEYDVVMLSMPDMDTILAVKGLCRKNSVKMIVDVRDLRPEVFRLIIKNDFLYSVLLAPMHRTANKAYAAADELLAVSQEYLDRGLQTNTKSKTPKAIYIGAALDKFFDGAKKYAADFEKKDGEVWVTYAGTIGESYDLQTLIEAGNILEKKRPGVVKIKILGQGPDEAKLKKFTNSIQATNVDFIGFIPYEKMAAFLCKSDVTVNALKRTASQSIINKVADYFAAGIPMLNSGMCKEQRDMVDKYKVGFNYEPGNANELVSYIERFIDDRALWSAMGSNARKLALEKFDRKTSYLEIIKTIDEV